MRRGGGGERPRRVLGVGGGGVAQALARRRRARRRRRPGRGQGEAQGLPDGASGRLRPETGAAVRRRARRRAGRRAARRRRRACGGVSRGRARGRRRGGVGGTAATAGLDRRHRRRPRPSRSRAEVRRRGDSARRRRGAHLSTRLDGCREAAIDAARAGGKAAARGGVFRGALHVAGRSSSSRRPHLLLRTTRSDPAAATARRPGRGVRRVIRAPRRRHRREPRRQARFLACPCASVTVGDGAAGRLAGVFVVFVGVWVSIRSTRPPRSRSSRQPRDASRAWSRSRRRVLVEMHADHVDRAARRRRWRTAERAAGSAVLAMASAARFGRVAVRARSPAGSAFASKTKLNLRRSRSRVTLDPVQVAAATSNRRLFFKEVCDALGAAGGTSPAAWALRRTPLTGGDSRRLGGIASAHRRAAAADVCSPRGSTRA